MNVRQAIPAVLSSAMALAIVAAAPSSALAQALTVQTALSDPVVPVGDTVTLQVTVTARISGAIEVRLPQVDGLTETSRQQSQSQSVSWSSSGQQVLTQQVYTVEYRANRPGEFQIGPVTARVGRRRAQSTPVTVRVQRGQAPAAKADDATPNEVAAPGPGESSLFLRYRVNRSEPYLGQGVLLDLEVISDPNQQNFQVEETTGLPEVEGFWTQILEQPRRLKPKRVKIKGREYVSYRIWRAALYPLKAGTLTVPTVKMEFRRGGGLFTRGRLMRRFTRPLRLNVKPLPSEGRPSNFVSTNVGRYKLTATVDQRRVKAGKALLYTLRLSGRGNISSAKLPTLGRVANFRVFAPTVRDEVKTSAAGVRGFKEAEYLLMPQKGGKLTIPSVSLTTFDPLKGKYRTLKTKPIRVTVVGTPDPSTAPEPAAVAAMTADAATPESMTLRPLRFTSSLSSPSSPPWRHAWFWLLLILPGAASAGRAGWQWSQAREANPTPQLAQKAANRRAAATLESARADVTAGELADAHAKIAESLRDFGTQTLGVSLQGLTLEAVAEQTKARGLSADDTRDLIRLLEAADYARYAPSQLTEAAAQADIYRAEQLLSAFAELEGAEPS